jgi:hypothetical protein
MGGKFIADSFIAQFAFIEPLEAPASQKQSSCFEKKALPILTVVTLSGERYGLSRSNQPLPPKDDFSAPGAIERSISVTPVLRARGSRDCNSDAEKISTSFR